MCRLICDGAPLTVFQLVQQRAVFPAGDLYHSMVDCLVPVHFDELERQMEVAVVVLNPTSLVFAQIVAP